MSNKSRRQNVKNLNSLLSEGKLNQYFSLGRSSIEELANAVRKNNIDDINRILEENISPNGEGITEIIDNGYDAQITQLAGDIVKGEIDIIETEILKSFKEKDLETIRNKIKEIDNLSEISGIKRRTENIKKQLLKAELELAIPEEVRGIALRLLKEKGKNVSDIRTTKVIEEWGRNKKRALVSWGKKGIIGVEYLDKPVKIKKIKLEYSASTKEAEKIKEEIKSLESKIYSLRKKLKRPEEIISKKGKFFSLKERNFVKSRKNKKSNDEIIEDYFRVFGKVRTKSEIKKLINKEK